MKLIIQSGAPVKNAKVGVLGLTFKENCPDFRNSKSFDVIQELRDFSTDVLVHDPYANPTNLAKQGLNYEALETMENLDALVLCVSHQVYLDQLDTLLTKLKPNAYLIDVKGVYTPAQLATYPIWQL